jgi:hypothetical protein
MEFSGNASAALGTRRLAEDDAVAVRPDEKVGRVFRRRPINA